MLHWTPYLIAWVVLAGGIASVALGQESNISTILKDLRGEDREQIVATLASVEAFQNDASLLVKELSAIIDDDEYSASDIAFRALARMKSKALPAAGVLCRRLEDQRHWVRASAVTTLVAIGPDVSVSVRSTLKSKSGSARAAATEVLARLQLLDLAECQTLLKDADPRVRAAVARSLSKLGKPAVTVLAEMLADPESAVGAQAIRALQINHADPQVAIGGLTRVLQRSEIRDSAGTALGSYGTLAQRAIPTIISAVPSERPIFFYYHTDGAALALRHIGPPHPDDVPQICQTLKQGPYPASFIAAESLLTLGPEGKAVADDLAATAIRWAEEYRLAKARIPQEMQNDFTGNESVSILWGAERCATAFWHVTHDDRRFFELLEVLIKKAGDPLFIYDPELWEQIPFVRKLAESPDQNVKQTISLALVQKERNAAEQTKSPPKMDLSSLIEQLSASPQPDLSVFKALAEHGKDAQPAIPVLQSLLENDNLWTQMQAAQVLYLIQGDPGPFQRRLDKALAFGPGPLAEMQHKDPFSLFPDDFYNPYRHSMWKAIEGCKQKENPFIKYLLSETLMAEPYGGEISIKALQAIGTPEAVAELEKLAESTDWELKSAATKALKRLRSTPSASK